VLSKKLGYIVPGTKTIPDKIVANRQPYFEALESADRAWDGNNVDVSQTESLLERLLLNQLTSGLDHIRTSGVPDPVVRDSYEPLAPRPAPFNFLVVDGVIDVAPETAMSLDAQTTNDLITDVQHKVHLLFERVGRTNASLAFKEDIGRLQRRLEGSLRPGLILSSLRSIEAHRAYFLTSEGSLEIAGDAFRLLDDLCNTVRELAATFPKSREIEAEAVSLGIPLEEKEFNQILLLTTDVMARVMSSDAATEGAKEALSETNVSIGSNQSLAEQAKQVSYHILDIDNFARAGVRYLREGSKFAAMEVLDVGGGTYRSFKKDFTERAGKAASIAVLGGISGLLYNIGFEISGLATMISALIPLKNSITGANPRAQDKPENTETNV
jgi:hypothetical protein